MLGKRRTPDGGEKAGSAGGASASSCAGLPKLLGRLTRHPCVCFAPAMRVVAKLGVDATNDRTLRCGDKHTEPSPLGVRITLPG